MQELSINKRKKYFLFFRSRLNHSINCRDQVVQCLKLISRPGSERIIQYAFEYARRHGRKKVSCFVKDNIMKMTDGLFSKGTNIVNNII